MKIVTLVENRSERPDLQSEHGLSLYIEAEKHKILFDTGQSDLFIRNAERAGIDLREVTIVVISHGHYDHIRGLVSFLHINPTAKVVLKREIFDYQYYSIREDVPKPIGWPEELLEYKERFVFPENGLRIDDTLLFISEIERVYPLPKGNRMLFRSKGSRMEPDDFRHELIFCIDCPEGVCLFSGCAHNGIANMLHTAKKHCKGKKMKYIVGGLHLVDENPYVATESEKELEEVVADMERLSDGAQLITGHCTGNKALSVLSERAGNRFQTLYAGHIIEI